MKDRFAWAILSCKMAQDPGTRGPESGAQNIPVYALDQVISIEVPMPLRALAWFRKGEAECLDHACGGSTFVISQPNFPHA
jgi:hypothetical protein